MKSKKMELCFNEINKLNWILQLKSFVDNSNERYNYDLINMNNINIIINKIIDMMIENENKQNIKKLEEIKLIK